MDFTFSDEQEDLRRTVRAFMARPGADRYRSDMTEDARGFTDAWWEETAALGWPGLMAPADLGGTGLGLLDAVVVQEEMGRVALPGPYFSSAVAATIAVNRLGDRTVLADLACGRRRGTVAIEEVGHGDPLATVATRAVPAGDAWALTGTKPVVLDGHTADVAVVAARTDDGLAAFVVDAPAGTLEPCLDVTRRVARLELDGRPARRIGPPGDQTGILARVCDDIAVALCAETVGCAERALEMAIDHAKGRVQFGRPIATFQAIRHKIVDMLHQLELARVGTHWAAWCSQVDDPLRARAAAACKGFVAEAAVMVTGECIQIHGGVGFTWDLDCHRLFRRVKQNDVLFASQGTSRARLADLVLGPS